MGRFSQACLLLALLLLLCLFNCGCGAADSAALPTGPEAGAIEVPTLPAPGDLARQAAVSGELHQQGADYLDSLPHLHVSRLDTTALYAPLGYRFSEMAFAGYSFNLSGATGAETAYFAWSNDWNFSSAPSNFWIALANWDSNSWQWFQASLRDSFDISSIDAYVRDSDGTCLLLLAFLGSEQPQLASLGFARAPLVTGVDPLELQTGAETTMTAQVSGSQPLSYAWSFGAAATPDSSTNPAPLIVAGAPGSYDCSLTVSNAYGEASFPFTLQISAVPSGWSHTFGISSSNWVVDSALTAEGDIVLLLWRNWLLRLAPTGEVQWSRNYGPEGLSIVPEGGGVEIDSLGDICVSGLYNSDISAAEGLFAEKIAADGTPVWFSYWPGSCAPVGGRLALDSADHIYIAGTALPPSQGLGDLLLLEFKPDGSLDAQHVWGNEDADTGEDVAVDSQDNVYLAGYRLHSDGSPSNTFYSLLLKYDPQGVLSRAQSFDGAGSGRLTLRPNDNLLYSYDKSSGMVIAELNPAGEAQWARSYQDHYSCYFSDLLVNADGSLALCGSFRTSGVSKANTEFLRLDSSGALQSNLWWDIDSAQETFEALEPGPAGSFYLFGAGANAQGAWQDITADVVVTDVTANPTTALGSSTEATVVASTTNLLSADQSYVLDTGGGKLDALAVWFEVSN